VVEFTRISWPFVLAESAAGCVVESRRRIVERGEVVGERRDVVWTHPKRGDGELSAGESMIEVLAKGAIGHGGPEVALGGGQDTGAEGALGAVADRRESSVLEYAQEDCLERKGDVRDLVENQGALARRLESSGAVGDGVREGTADMSEKGALE